MNITKDQIDNLNAVINVQIEEADYQPNIDKKLSDLRRTATLKGFRAGQVPKDLIRKMYGNQVLLEEVNKVLNSSLENYIDENKLEILGRPMIKEESENAINWDVDKSFKFSFDIALKPQVEVELSAKQKYTKYKINVTDKIIDETIAIMAERLGELSTVDVSDKNDIVKGEFVEIDANGNVIEGGVKNISAAYPRFFKNEGAKKKFIGLKIGDKAVFETKELIENETDFSIMLGIKKEQIATLSNKIQLTVNEVSRMVPHAVDQDMFDKIFGKDAIKDETEFKAKITAEKEKEFAGYIDNQLKVSIHKSLIETIKVDLPAEFLKRFFMAQNKEISEAEYDETFPEYSKTLKWELIKSSIGKEADINLEKEELDEFIKENIKNHMKQQYGLQDNDIKDDFLTNYIIELQQKHPQEIEKLIDGLFEKKVFDVIFNKVSLVEKEILWDDFIKLEN